jgi:hypothetical protein
MVHIQSRCEILLPDPGSGGDVARRLSGQVRSGEGR